MPPDISVILNVHNETVYLQRTLLSLAETASYCRASGASLELILVLDSPPEETLRLAEACVSRDSIMYPYDRVHLEVVNNRSLGPSRNDGIALAKGEYVALHDADDLVSFNLLHTCLEQARLMDHPGLVFPNYYAEFGFQYTIARYDPLSCVTPLAMLGYHPFTSRSFGPRWLFDEIHFDDSSPFSGYAYEDWHFNCEVIAAGYDLVIAPDTVLFYRKRRGSLLLQSERDTAGRIRPSRLFEPARYREICQFDYDMISRRKERNRIQHVILEHDSGARLMDLPFFQELFIAANRIDPGVDPIRFAAAGFWSNMHGSLRAGMVYYEASVALRHDQYDDVFILPYLVSGGAEKYLIMVMRALVETGLGRRILVICGQATAKRAWLDRLPDGTDLVDLAYLDPGLDDEGIDSVTVKLLQAVAPQARLHIKQSEFAFRFFRNAASILKGHKAYFYRFTDDRRIFEDRIVTEQFGLEFVSDCGQALAGVISDHQRILDEDQRRFGLWPDKWRCLPAPCEVSPKRSRSALSARQGPLRLLWASRLDGQKRPELIAAIARQCATRGIDVIIDVFGSTILGGFEIDELTGNPGVHYRGGFTDFHGLPIEDYDAFLYTSLYDGMPNVILEAMSAGLPPIAPSLDGIPEVVRDGETGCLVPNLADPDALVSAYCDSIAVIYRDAGLCRRLSEACVVFIKEERSQDLFQDRVREIFGASP
ncbi:glycosyltransferase [Acidiphilium sp. PM]|uniref:glycosyltransferase n=1 Tax=Acidiphilium sp. PM TaxID=1043206 RepID=UPI00021459E5|nr:glycosyltransferase [Acidiphilium sp. PM]EGO94096.1 Glycosyl transferase, group 1 [Acidiphilium sp. PM]